jgi:hypothetical protein
MIYAGFERMAFAAPEEWVNDVRAADEDIPVRRDW